MNDAPRSPPIGSLADLRRLCQRLPGPSAAAAETAAKRQAELTKPAGSLGRLAATLYNLTRGDRPRARIVHTYHGHVLEGYFGGFKTRLFITFERLLARLSDALIAIAPGVRDELLNVHRIGSAGPADPRVTNLG